MTTSWRGHFDALQPDSPLYERQATLYVDALAGAIGLRPAQRVLDFGCGFGFVAALVAPRVAEVWWWDGSGPMRTATEQRLAGVPNTRLCDLSGLPFSPGPSLAWPASGFELILVNSVVQYMPPEEVVAWLPWWRRMLASSGRVVMSDLIPSNHGPLSDVVDLLRLGIRERSPLRAAAGALGGATKYLRARRYAPLTRFTRASLAGQASRAGFETAFLDGNLTHFRRRWTAVLRPSGDRAWSSHSASL